VPIVKDRTRPTSPRYFMALIFCFGGWCGQALTNRIQIETNSQSTTSASAPAIADFAGPADIQEQMAQLRAIGYLGEADSDLEQKGVVHFDRERTQPGVNLYNPAHAAEAYLIDLEGNILHRWALPLEEAFPEGAKETRTNRYWRRVRMLDDGGLLAIYEGVGVIRLDRESNLVWAQSNAAHHDFELTDDGRLAVLRRKAHSNSKIHPTDLVLEDFIELLDLETGSSLETFSIYDAFEDSSYASAISSRADAGDIFHTNTLQILDGIHTDQIPAFARGNFLISVHALSMIAVIDSSSHKVVWSMAGQWEAQHEPQLLDNGNLLLFDNRGHGDWSKVIEIDPRTQEIRWAFYGTPENDFHSLSLGSQQRLANGNTLITETNAGRVREIAADGTEVWRFHSPHLTPVTDPDRSGLTTARICEMLRLRSSEVRMVLSSAEPLKLPIGHVAKPLWSLE
jgi:hypothetical protein